MRQGLLARLLPSTESPIARYLHLPRIELEANSLQCKLCRTYVLAWLEYMDLDTCPGRACCRHVRLLHALPIVATTSPCRSCQIIRFAGMVESGVQVAGLDLDVVVTS
jgi:hypothetical protein